MKIPITPIRVLFLLQRPEAWGNVASLWRAMANDSEFEPVAWLLPYNAEDMPLSIGRLQLHKRLLASQGVSWVEWEAGLHLAAEQFDVAIFTHPYDRERPRSLWFDRVRACVSKIIYVPYGLSVGAGAKNLRLQFAQPLQIGADLIVARSPAEKAMYARYCPAGDSKVQVLGHPRFDRLLEGLRATDVSGLNKRIGNRTAILWNSHFSFGHRFSQSSNFSTFDLLGPEILDYFATYRTILCLVWRPHPGLFPELLKQGLLSQEQLEKLPAELDDLGVVLDEQADHLSAFACSQALVSDPGTFLFEYLATGKPLLPLINREGEPLNAEAISLVAACGSASNFREVECFIAGVVKGSIDYKRYATLRERYLPLLDGNAGLRICSVVRGQVKPNIGGSHLNLASNGEPAYRSILYQSPLAGVAEVCMPPVVAQLQASLRQIRAEKAAQSRLRKWSRRQLNRFRTSAGEFVKKRSWLMAMSNHIRNVL